MNVGLQWTPKDGAIEPTLPEGKTGAVRVAVGNASQSPASPQVGMLRYDTETHHLIAYVGQPAEESWERILTDFDIGMVGGRIGCGLSRRTPRFITSKGTTSAASRRSV